MKPVLDLTPPRFFVCFFFPLSWCDVVRPSFSFDSGLFCFFFNDAGDYFHVCRYLGPFTFNWFILPQTTEGIHKVHLKWKPSHPLNDVGLHRRHLRARWETSRTICNTDLGTIYRFINISFSISVRFTLKMRFMRRTHAFNCLFKVDFSSDFFFKVLVQSEFDGGNST